MAKQRRPWWLDWIFILAAPAVIGGVYLYDRHRQQPDLDLIRNGGGEVHFVAVEWMRCRQFPGHVPRRERLSRFRESFTPPDVSHRERFEVVARRDGYALGGADGEICWLPEWALAARRPQWLPCDRRGSDYFAALPSGWEEPPPPFGLTAHNCSRDAAG